MIRVYLIRHGETDWNHNDLCMGQKDIPLNALGHRQAELTAECLAEEKLASIYSSDLSRALQTAQIIARPHRLDPVSLKTLRELDYGRWEGHTREEIERLFPEARAINWEREDSLSFQPPGGERRDALYQRATQEFQAICERHPDQSVVLVVHGGVIRALVNYVLNLQAKPLVEPFYTRAFACSNCGVTLLEPNRWDAFRIVYLNDTSHLRSLDVSSHSNDAL
jgi:alpha-ribazole phosphatase/probable phosphoglycerate mutase